MSPTIVVLIIYLGFLAAFAVWSRSETKSLSGYYLAGKQLAGRSLCREALAVTRLALARGLPNADFEIEALRVLGRCAYRTGELFTARRIFARLARRPALPTGVRLAVEDWLERIGWRLGEPTAGKTQ